MSKQKECMICGSKRVCNDTAYCRKHLKEVEYFLALDGLYPQVSKYHIAGECFVCGDTFHYSRSLKGAPCCSECLKQIKSGTSSKNNYVSHSNNKESHRDIASKAMGRKIKANEVVHHINFDKSDNTLSNLLVLSRKYHNRLHVFLHQQRILVESNSTICDSADWDYITREMTIIWLTTANIKFNILSEI